MVVVNIVAILAGAASVLLAEYSDEARTLEVYNIFPQIIRSQRLYYMQHNQYYDLANHNELKDHGVDVSEAVYFTYSTFPNEPTFSVRADATEWATGGWVQYDHQGDPTWSCDGVLIKRSWLPG